MFREILIEGTLPDGGHDAVSIRVASIVPFFVMKGMALHDRLKEKDASADHVGPKFVADFEEITDAAEREFIQRDAFERVRYLIEKLKE